MGDEQKPEKTKMTAERRKLILSGWYELHAGSGQDTLDLTPSNISLAGQRVFIGPWANKEAFIGAMYATGHPNILFCYALQFQTEPFGKPLGVNAWENAKVTVGYKNLPFDPTTLKEVSVETSAENVSLQNDGYEFEDGATPADKRVDLNPQNFVIFTQISVTFHNQTVIDEATWVTCVNKVNSGGISFGTGLITWPPGQLLYTGYSVTEKYATNGLTYDITHKFLGSQIDHRMEWNPHIGDWDKVKAKASGKYKYDEADFSVLS